MLKESMSRGVWLPKSTDADVKRLIDDALWSYSILHPTPSMKTLDGFVYDRALTFNGERLPGRKRQIVGANRGKCTTKIKLHVNNEGQIHAFPWP